MHGDSSSFALMEDFRENSEECPSSQNNRTDMRKSNKPIMEKRRRARINNCLNDLKGILLEAMRKDPARHSKLEKADILELTVRHLQSIQRNQLAVAMATDPTVLYRFKNGFSECASEVGRYLSKLDGVEEGMKGRVSSHLTSCVNGLQQVGPPPVNTSFLPVQATAPPPNTTTILLPPGLGSGDLNNNSNNNNNSALPGMKMEPMIRVFRPTPVNPLLIARPQTPSPPPPAFLPYKRAEPEEGSGGGSAGEDPLDYSTSPPKQARLSIQSPAENSNKVAKDSMWRPW